MKLETFDTLPGDPAELYPDYYRLFEPLRTLAAQRHVATGDEFAHTMNDPRWTKYLVAADDGRFAGIGTLTNQWDAIPLVEPEFYRARWPQEFDRQAIWYVGFIGADPDVEPAAFPRLLQEMSAPAADAKGLCFVDYCRYNRNDRRLHDASLMMLRRTHGHSVEIRDGNAQGWHGPVCVQYYDGYDFRRRA